MKRILALGLALVAAPAAANTPYTSFVVGAPAVTPSGTEPVAVISGGATKQATAQSIANLAPVQTVFGRTGAVTGAFSDITGSLTLAQFPSIGTSTTLCNATGGSAVPTACSPTTLTSLLNVATSSLQGVVPASGGGTTNFLRADLTWATPTGSGSGTVNSGTANQLAAYVSGGTAVSGVTPAGDVSAFNATTGAVTVTKTNGNAFAASATTDTTNATNITSGTLPAGRLPNPSASTLGGVQSFAAVANQFINTISTSGGPASRAIVAGDLPSGTAVWTVNLYTSGTTTWNKPSGVSVCYVKLEGGGGGGGGGAMETLGTVGTGGGGGGGAPTVARWFRAADLAGSYSVTVGAGGAGGLGATVAGPGAVGAIGANTTFGSLFTAYYGGFGSGGQTAANSGGGGSGGFFANGGNSASGAAGSAGTWAGTAGGSGAVGGTPLNPDSAGGGAGSSVTAAFTGGVGIAGGGASGGTELAGSSVAGGTGGAALGVVGGTLGANLGGNGGNGGQISPTDGGSGGGGGGGFDGGTGGTGGNGGNGAGGGGGGAGTGAGGNGGSGGNGFAFVACS